MIDCSLAKANVKSGSKKSTPVHNAYWKIIGLSAGLVRFWHGCMGSRLTSAVKNKSLTKSLPAKAVTNDAVDSGGETNFGITIDVAAVMVTPPHEIHAAGNRF